MWVTLPSSAAADASGLCAQKCSGLPLLPNYECGSDVCLPVLTTEALFSSGTLDALEDAAQMGTSTRGEARG